MEGHSLQKGGVSVLMDMARYWRWSKKRDEQLKKQMIPLCQEIERILLRATRGNLELTGEVLDARELRYVVFGK